MNGKAVTRFLMSAYAVTFVFTLTALAQSGGYRPVADTNDAGVDMAAKFAVSEQSTRSKTTVTLNSVVKASDKEPILSAQEILCCALTRRSKPNRHMSKPL